MPPKAQLQMPKSQIEIPKAQLEMPKSQIEIPKAQVETPKVVKPESPKAAATGAAARPKLFCHICGEKFLPDANFCCYCGTKR